MKKKKKIVKEKIERMRVCVTNAVKDCQGGRPPTNNTATVLTTANICTRVPEGLNARTDGLTDRPTVSSEVTDSDRLSLEQRPK
jgi:hypothetical protein